MKGNMAFSKESQQMMSENGLSHKFILAKYGLDGSQSGEEPDTHGLKLFLLILQFFINTI
jgi:hypothetical protein